MYVNVRITHSNSVLFELNLYVIHNIEIYCPIVGICTPCTSYVAYTLAPVGSKGSWCSGPLAVSSGWGRGEDA